MAFGVCSSPFSLTLPIILKHSTIERGFQKPPFCVAKVWFLACKKWVFALQKYGFCFLRECFLFYNTSYRVHEHPQNGIAYSHRWYCNSVIFIVPVPTKFHQMALRIRTVGVAILLFYLLYPTFCHVHSVGVGADLSCPCPRNSTKWRCVFPPLILQYIIPHPRNSTKWRCNSHHFDTSKPFGSD